MDDDHASKVHKLCDFLFDTVSFLGEGPMPPSMIALKGEVDLMTGNKHIAVKLAQQHFPPEIKKCIDPSTERDAIAFFNDLDIVCKVADEAAWGRVFIVNLPGEPLSFSWDEFRNKKPKRPQ